MRLNDTARVGLTVLVALGALTGVNLWLSGALHPSHTYVQNVRFPNAQGIQAGGFVRVQGVDMGSVEKVTLAPDGQALIGLRMRDAYHIQPTDGIRIVINPVGFAQPFVEITPGARAAAAPALNPDGTLSGDSGLSQDQLLTQTNQL